MGDTISELSINKELQFSDNDVDNVYNFFSTDLTSIEEPSESTTNEKFMEILKFVALFSIVFYLVSHPISIGRFIQNPVYKLIAQTLTFAVILFLYLYFNK